MVVSHAIVLTFPPSLVSKPITYHLVKDYNLTFSILRAHITEKEEGLLVLEITGKEADYKKGLAFIREQGITAQPLSQDVVRNESKCTQCGACVVICPTGALYIQDRKTMQVGFDQKKCIACEHCIKTCPMRAMEIHF
jgi:L-aspartate semialdehyde sulfurtransferase ferredoxin